MHDVFERAGIACWLFGGWAVSFYAGLVTRAHDDLDIAVWLDDLPRIGELLEAKRNGRAPWSEDALGDDVQEVHGVRSRIVGLQALTRGKASARGDPEEAAKDRADFAVLSRL